MMRWTIGRWQRAERERAAILQSLARIEQGMISMGDKIDDVGDAVQKLKTAIDAEVADLQTVRNDLALRGTLTPDQTQRLDVIIANLGAATDELTADDQAPASTAAPDVPAGATTDAAGAPVPPKPPTVS